MPGTWDLEIDTYWIRRAAASMDQASSAFASAGVDQLPVPLSPTGLGPSDAAAAVVNMVNARNGQAHAAAAQLHAVNTAIARQIGDAADRFDRIESTIARPTR